MQIDFGKTASDYGRHRAGFPEQFFDRIFRAGLVSPGIVSSISGPVPGRLHAGWRYADATSPGSIRRCR